MTEKPEKEQRGYFWWATEPIPAGQFAPNKGAFGLLTISAKGRIDLKLDGLISDRPFAIFATGDLPANQRIFGILIPGNEHVVLTGIRRNGGNFSTNSFSRENFLVEFCLVGSSDLFDLKESQPINIMRVSLAGYEQWIGRGSIRTKITKGTTKVSHAIKPKHSYKTTKGHADIEFNIDRPSISSTSETQLILTETTDLCCRRVFASFSDIAVECKNFEDLFFLFTNVERNLTWPRVGFNKRSTYATLYFQKLDSPNIEIQLFDVWLTYTRIQSDFQTILTKWQQKNEQFGSGSYLYIGTRRGLKLYSENKFVNYIWGLESLHRTIYGSKKSPKLTAKKERIMSQITLPKDHRWLEGKLSSADEPTLQERIFQLFEGLPLPITPQRLTSFCAKCAKYRNDISHFGGSRGTDSYRDFIQEINLLVEALEVLYHLRLLREIGISAPLLTWITDQSFRSFSIKMALWMAGLLDEDPRNAAREAAKKSQEVAKRALQQNADAEEAPITNQPLSKSKRTRGKKPKN